MTKAKPKTYLDGVDMARINRAKVLKPIRRLMDEKHGEGNWGDKEVAAYIKWRDEEGVVSVAHRKKDARAKTVSGRLAAKIKAYIEQFDNPTQNDIASIGMLAELEVRMEEAQDELSRDNVTSTDFKRYSDSIIAMSREHRSLQGSLGIDRSTRGETSSGIDEVKKYVQGAKALLYKHAIPLLCDDCLAKGVKINQGFVYAPFAGYAPLIVKTKCVQCRKDITIRRRVTKTPVLTEAFSDFKDDEPGDGSGGAAHGDDVLPLRP